MERRQLGFEVFVILVLGLSAFASTEDSKLTNRVRSSLVFQLNGNVYPTGAYNVTVLIGQPPRPYFLDPDTGSDLTWLQCDAPCQQCTQAPHPHYTPNDDLVVCRDPMCASLHGPGEHMCDNPTQCDYEVDYADGGSSLGVLVNDIFSLQLLTGIPLSPRLALGCGYDQVPGRTQPFLDGVLGLGRGRTSLLTQLHNQGLVRNVIGHCFSSKGGGYLFIGDELYDTASLMWAQMPRDTNHYSPGPAELTYGDRSTGFRNLPVYFDSGSTFTYFSAPVYQALSYLMKNSMLGKPLFEAFDDVTLPLCWKGKRPFRHVREATKFFKPINMHFRTIEQSRVKFDILPESYLIISPLGKVCLGILNGTDSGLQQYNVIGVWVILVLLGLSAFASSDASTTANTTDSKLRNRVKSSLVFQLNGDVYPSGAYSVTVLIGQPPRPYSLNPDTGSDLTWLQCNAPCQKCTHSPHPYYTPNDDLVVCRDPICASLHGPGQHMCDNPKKCDYEVDYADGGSSQGMLVNDIFSLQLSTGIPLSPRLSLGCGYNQIPGQSQPSLDGVLGLGRGRTSLLTQLHDQGLVRNMVGHCFSSRGGGYLFIGDELDDGASLEWAQMPQDTNHYSPGPAELTYGGRSTGFRDLPVYFSSGSSYTYFSAPVYQALSYLMKNSMLGKPLFEAFDDVTLPLCWKGKRPFRNVLEAKRFFKPINMHFWTIDRSRVKFEILPESYLIISPLGNVCLGILNGTDAGLQHYNVIGDISMQDKLVVYDNERGRIGWMQETCHRMPKGGIAMN